MTHPDPLAVHPVPAHPRLAFLKPLVDSSRIVVGDFTYYDDPDGPTSFAERNVLYGYGPERLVIGRFCAIGAGTRFLMAGGAHPSVGASTFPFAIFGGAWTEQTVDLVMALPSRGDTVVGNDVWFGYHALVMPGVRIGDGAVIAAGAVVTGDVEPYTVVGGSPARPIRRRFDDEDVARLQRAAWWDWPVEMITAHARTIMSGTPADVERVALENGLVR